MSNIGQEDFSVEIAGGKYVATRLVGGGTRWFRYGEPWDSATDDWQHANAINALIDELHEARSTPKGDAPDVGRRAAHYGAGRQPWDDIVDTGWAPAFAAGNALKYVRRAAAKNGEDDLKKGRWYYDALNRLVLAERRDSGLGDDLVSGRAIDALNGLDRLLTPGERATLQEGLTA